MRAPTLVLGVALLSATPALAAPSPAGALDRLLDGLQAARRAAGAPALERRAELDAVASRRARHLAGLSASRRLDSGDSIEDLLREAGVRRFRRAAYHVGLERGHRDAAAALLGGWREYEASWREALDPAHAAVGLGSAVGADGWTILVAVLVEDLPLPDDPARVERETVQEVNRIRMEQGLGALAVSPDLTAVARAHSEDMSRRGFFGHRSPDGRMPEDRLRARGIGFAQLGENVQRNRGYRDPMRAAVEAWLASPGHRETLLTPDYRETGVGVAVDPDGNVFFTQLFLKPREAPR